MAKFFHFMSKFFNFFIIFKFWPGTIKIRQTQWQTMLYLAKLGIKQLRQRLSIEEVWFLDRAPGGFAAGKTVSHAHAHLIPFNPKLFQWKFQEVTIHPQKLAKLLR